MSKKKNNIIITSGKRKSAVATATMKQGTGIILINKEPLATLNLPKIYHMRIQEPLILAGETSKKYDISVTSKGGGMAGQADAIRLAIAKALATDNKNLEQTFLDYDRTLMVADVRRKEPKKPNTRGHARSKRQKSYR